MVLKQEQSFPEVAVLRKGKPKKNMTKKRADGSSYTIQVVGEDLNQKMRLHFLPGTDAVKADFHAAHPRELVTYPENYTIREGEYELTRLNAVVPATNVWSAWEYGNEVYQAGRRLGLADDDHYIYLKDPLDGNKFLVKDGEPYRKFEPGEVIHYERDNKSFDLKMKVSGRLRLVLTDLMSAGQLVQVTLKTTSYYDCLNIKNQLAGIQAIADIVKNGNAGGVIFSVYRSSQNVTWNKPDGGAMRVDKWFFNIQADPEWVKRAFACMSKNALNGETLAAALLPSGDISGPIDPETGALEEEEFLAGDVFESEFTEPETPIKPAKLPAQPSNFATDKVNALIFAGLAGNEFGAKGMLGLSNLPEDASPELAVAWAKEYRKFRPLKPAKDSPDAKKAADQANIWYTKYAQSI